MPDTQPIKSALLVVDPYNDFLSKGGSAWRLLREVDRDNQFVSHIHDIVEQARNAGMVIAYAPHHRYHDSSFSHRKYLHPANHQQALTKSFPQAGFGGKIRAGLEPREGDIVASEHPCSSGFAGTDLHVKLQQAGVTHLTLIGCISNSCIEATARSAVDLGYHVTVVSDAIGAFSPEEHQHAVNNTLPLIAHQLITTQQLLQETPSRLE